MSLYLITSQEIAEMEGTRKTHFSNPNAKRINKSLGDAAGLTGFGFHIIEVEPGHETTEHHLHHHEDECVFVLSGTATAVIGVQEFALGQGDFVGYRKGGLPHSIRNTGSEILRCIVVGERLPHDVCDYPRQNKRMFRNSGMPWNLVDLSAIEELGSSIGKK
jgi:uncharacterized cupin superfamily protein